jgi:hypothetical protein
MIVHRDPSGVEVSVAATHVVLLLAVAADPSAKVVSRAVVDPLAAPFVERPQVVLRELSELPAGPATEKLMREAKADAVVILTCAGAGCERADVRVTDDVGRTATRSLAFSRDDDLAERGRAVGLLASTLLPDGWTRLPPGGTAPSAAAAALPVAVVTPAASPPPKARWAIETTASLLTAPSAKPSGFGLTLGVRSAIAGGVAVRLAAKLELGDLPGNGGSDRSYGGAFGLGWTSASLERPGHFGAGARADFVLLYRRLHADAVMVDTMVTSVNLQALGIGGDAVGFVGYALSSATVLTAGFGAELLATLLGSGTSDDVRLGSSAPNELRWMAEVGVLARF